MDRGGRVAIARVNDLVLMTAKLLLHLLYEFIELNILYFTIQEHFSGAI
jgi:hypothetical protein